MNWRQYAFPAAILGVAAIAGIIVLIASSGGDDNGGGGDSSACREVKQPQPRGDKRYKRPTLQLSAKKRATEEFDDNVVVCIDYPGKSFDTVEPGDPVRVRVQVPFNFIKFFGWGVTIKGSATMRIERIADITAPVQPLANPHQNIRTCS